ncbi:hypothetical protein FB566_1144 [Stackebrandtia endophytica]|uniref:NB-ARC domain-containing protein n=1 Tax=Stackebrandtia endophytica TaxID=1496996 RepID=A0A543AT04_9ACTN|nr:hypothetical protein [Stackebrandtia endophytica]TQL75635.1 hypothetical protein FB566_1144 [Stackebrandtia endophytica]
MAAHDEGPLNRNEVSGAEVGGDLYQSQNLTVINRLPAVRKPPVPRGLPAPSSMYVNRVGEKRQMTTWTTSSDARSPVVLLSGRPGVGASSLAVEWGHHHDQDYPDGTLYADLRRERAEGGTAISAVLAQFLDSCGCDDVPPEFSARLQLFRTVTNKKRMLVVLDHVEHEAEVRTLRPASVRSAVVATCLHRGDYVTGQRDLPLKPMDLDAARLLVAKLLEPHEIEMSPEVDELIELCERVPKLLELAVGRMRRDANVTAADVTAWLHGELRAGGASILDIVAGDAYESLSTEAKRVYRVLGFHPGSDSGPHPGPDVAKDAILDLASSVDTDGPNVITELVDRHLLEPHTHGRYRLAYLMQAHARAQSRGIDGEGAERRVLALWTNWYVDHAQAADHAFIRDRNRVFAPRPQSTASFPDDKEAMAWLDAERYNLLALQRRLYELGEFLPVMQLGETMWVLYVGARYLEDWLQSSRLARDASIASAHRAGELRFRAFLARALMENAVNAPEPGRMFAEAERELDEAWAVSGATGIEIDLRASSMEFKGRLRSLEHRYREAIECHRVARDMFAEQAVAADASAAQRRANRRGVALQNQFIGVCWILLGEYEAAVKSLREAEAMLVDTDHYRDVAKIRIGIGEALRLNGDPAAAYEVLTQAVAALEGKTWGRVESDALWQLALVAEERDLPEVELQCLNRLRERYSAIQHPRLSEVDERLTRLSAG